MRLYLHPQDRDGLPVEVVISADEAERWIARLRSAVRDAREGQGDQMVLLGEPARIVMTVQERPERLDEIPMLRLRTRPDEPPPPVEALLTAGPAGLVVLLAFLSIAVFLALIFRYL